MKKTAARKNTVLLMRCLYTRGFPVIQVFYLLSSIYPAICPYILALLRISCSTALKKAQDKRNNGKPALLEDNSFADSKASIKGNTDNISEQPGNRILAVEHKCCKDKEDGNTEVIDPLILHCSFHGRHFQVFDVHPENFCCCPRIRDHSFQIENIRKFGCYQAAENLQRHIHFFSFIGSVSYTAF